MNIDSHQDNHKIINAENNSRDQKKKSRKKVTKTMVVCYVVRCHQAADEKLKIHRWEF